MHKCEDCGKISESKVKCNIVVLQRRVKHYKEGTTGYETVKEKKLCDNCKDIRQQKTTIKRGTICLI